MTIRKIRFVNSYEKLLLLSIHDEEISLAHRQVPNEISHGRSEKALAPGDLSAPGFYWYIFATLDTDQLQDLGDLKTISCLYYTHYIITLQGY